MSSQNANPAKAEVLKKIASLVDCLVNIKDENSEFLLTLEDGRVIDPKGWNDWEVCMHYRSRNEPALTLSGYSGRTA